MAKIEPASKLTVAADVVSDPTLGAPTVMALPSLGLASAWSDYMTDACQRSVLFLDLLRRRGDEQVKITAEPMATVLSFDHELVMSGKSLWRPINYSLLRIAPVKGAPTEPRKRPVVVVDPRAGQGPGIGGFKTHSEIGDALEAGHPVYFIGFAAEPEPGQQFLDVVEGQVTFFERVVELHPDAPRPFAIGNCQAGYQTLMVAMLRPDLFGPCLVVGSPMSYWQGEHGKNPMRYAGGISGGSWITAMTSDLGEGKFDGTWLVLNFDSLNPANWLWGKQYEVYANIDTGADRYLEFETWWGDFIQLNGGELQFLVDNLFIGDKLTRNALKARDGTTFDVRTITSPIIVFTSTEDNISPPPQTLGWILDLYPDADAIRVAGRTIVYCLDHKAGHLALFVSSKVGAKEDKEFVRMMDIIDCLPPGLFEMVISARPGDAPTGAFVSGDWRVGFEARSTDDLRVLGRNSPADDRAFATAERLSELNLAIYRNVLQPWVRAVANHPMAAMGKALNPLRLSYTLFADRNPGMAGVKTLADDAAQHRKPVAADNPFLALQTQISDQITASLDAYGAARDKLGEQTFFSVYGSPFVQAMFGIKTDAEVRPVPELPPQAHAAQHARAKAYGAMVTTGGFDAALTRAVLYVLSAVSVIDERGALALNVARKRLTHLSLANFKMLVRDQVQVLQLEPDRAIEALASMVPDADARKRLLEDVRLIVGDGGPPPPTEGDRLNRLTHLLPLPAKSRPAAIAAA